MTAAFSPNGFKRREIRRNVEVAGSFSKEDRQRYAELLMKHLDLIESLDRPNLPPNVTKDSSLINGLIIVEERRLREERNGAKTRTNGNWNAWATIETWMLLTLMNHLGQLSHMQLEVYTKPIRDFISRNQK